MTEQPAEQIPNPYAGQTHVLVRTPTGALWNCPVDFLPHALEQGYTEADDATADDLEPDDDEQTGFDPAEHSVEEVNAYLEQVAASGAAGEVARVLEAEAAGKNRSTVQAPSGDDTDD